MGGTRILGLTVMIRRTIERLIINTTSSYQTISPEIDHISAALMLHQYSHGHARPNSPNLATLMECIMINETRIKSKIISL